MSEKKCAQCRVNNADKGSLCKACDSAVSKLIGDAKKTSPKNNPKAN